MDEFTLAYITCALWSSTDLEGTPLDKDYTIDDIHPETFSKMVIDCSDFQKDNSEMIGDSLMMAGHDFWLTRNRHGAGFWDGYWKEDGKRLTEAAHICGEFSLYVGDDGLIYHV